jgi:hypothetical protein
MRVGVRVRTPPVVDLGRLGLIASGSHSHSHAFALIHRPSTHRSIPQQYAKVKAAEEVAAAPGLYETRGECRERQQEEMAEYVEIWVRACVRA